MTEPIYKYSELPYEEKEELLHELAEKDRHIAEMEKDNIALARIIHSDNKLLPALLNAVRALCEDYSEERAVNTIRELNRICAERKGTLSQYKRDFKKLPATGITSLDMALDYIKQKAYENRIEFDVIICGNIEYMIRGLITEEKLRIIVSDLLENAILAVVPCEYRQILFFIGVYESCYEIRVEDSGIAFEEETLRELGKKRTTTRKNEGGSGIGMMEVFDIMRETCASFIIEQLLEGARGLTKRVRVRFDGAASYTLQK